MPTKSSAAAHFGVPVLFACLLAMVLLVACANSRGGETGPGDGTVTGLPIAAETPRSPDGGEAATPETEEALSATLAAPAVTALTWWTPPSFSPATEDEAGSLLAAQLVAFEQANPTAAVEPVLKAPYGKGGLLDYLLNAQKVAPTLLPDLVTLSTDDLAVAMRAGLLQPLDNLLPEVLVNDLYPFAIEVGRLDGRLLAVQFDADIEHLVVNERRVPSPPRNWADVLDGGHTYAFPLGSEGSPGSAFLVQYLSAGGQFGPRGEPVVLNEQALFQVLDFYSQARSRSVIPAVALSVNTSGDCWALFTAGRVDMCNVLASRYLAERASVSNLAFGALPTVDGQPLTMSQGWVLAMIATDPERQAATARLIGALLDSQLNATWSWSSHRLPVRRSALALWDQGDPYVSFLHWQLEAAVVHPSGTSYQQAARILDQAQRQVLDGTTDARAATEQATGVSLP